MSRPAPVPFDPDTHGCVTTAPRAAAPSPPPTLLSDIISALPPEEEEEAPTRTPARPLSNKEKRDLSTLARATYNALKGSGVLIPGETEAAFRQRVAKEACGRRISEAAFPDRMLIQAAFLRLKGNTQAAARAVVKAANTGRDIALFKLSQALKEGGKSEAYAIGIAHRIYKRNLAELTEKEVWTVIYTVRNANNAAAGKGQAANRYKNLRASRAASKETKSL